MREKWQQASVRRQWKDKKDDRQIRKKMLGVDGTQRSKLDPSKGGIIHSQFASSVSFFPSFPIRCKVRIAMRAYIAALVAFVDGITTE